MNSVDHEPHLSALFPPPAAQRRLPAFLASASQLLEAWCEAVRHKPNWPAKVLDKERGLLAKWFAEAQLEEKGVLRGDFERAAE